MKPLSRGWRIVAEIFILCFLALIFISINAAARGFPEQFPGQFSEQNAATVVASSGASLSPAPIPTLSSSFPSSPRVATTTLFFVGDIMLDRGVKKAVMKYDSGDYSRLFDKVGFLKGYDILFGNLEGPVSDKGRDLHNLYSFRMDPAVLPVLQDVGFDALSVVNNHVGDWGQKAYADELARFASSTAPLSITPVGGGMDYDEATAPRVIEKNGVKIGFLGFTDVGPNWLEAKAKNAGIALASDPHFTDIVRAAAAKCDVLVVSFHWGVEYQKHSNARQEKLAHEAIDAGASLVIGTHPHVAEELEEYHGGLIAYSLGNFIFDQYFSEDTLRGLGLEVDLHGTQIGGYSKHWFKLNAENQPEAI